MSATAVPRARGASLPPWLQLLRPHQWIKNLLVFASPAAAGVLDEREYLTRSVVLFVAFCLAASGAYCLNDVADVEADKVHPRKRLRPVAAGTISRSSALVLGIGLLVAGLGLTLTTGDWEPTAVLAVYVVLQPLYSVWLKHVAVVDLLIVAAGFVLRAVIGVVGTDVPISDWYLIVASFGSLFLVAGKRSAELALDQGGTRRGSLESYTPAFLLLVRGVALSITLLAYCLWAFEKATVDSSSFPWFQLSIVPFTAILLRYSLVHEATGDDAGPEDIVLGDRSLQVIGLLWVLCLAAGVYVAGTPPLPG